MCKLTHADDEPIMRIHQGYRDSHRWPKKMYWGPDDGTSLIHPYNQKHPPNKKTQTATWHCPDKKCSAKLHSTFEGGKDIIRMTGTHCEECKGKRGVPLNGWCTYEESEKMDLRAEFKKRCADLAVGEMAHFKSQKILDRVTREFASQYPSGAVFPTSKQVSLWNVASVVVSILLFEYLNNLNILFVRIFVLLEYLCCSDI